MMLRFFYWLAALLYNLDRLGAVRCSHCDEIQTRSGVQAYACRSIWHCCEACYRFACNVGDADFRGVLRN